MANVVVPVEFAYPILTFLASVILVQWLGYNVGKSRKKYGIKYPAMYSESCHIFNCVQRAHLNTLEAYPVFLGFLIFSSIFNAKLTAVAGMVWVASRVVFALAYYTGEPSKRHWGAFGYLGMLYMLINTAYGVTNLLRS